MQDHQVSTSPPPVDALDFLINPRVTSSTEMYRCTEWIVDGSVALVVPVVPVVPVSPGLATCLRPYPPSCHRRQ